MKRDIALFISKCMICQQVKAKYQKSGGTLQTLLLVDRLTKTAWFILIKIDYSVSKLCQLYVKQIVRLHSVPISILSDKDLQITSKF